MDEGSSHFAIFDGTKDKGARSAVAGKGATVSGGACDDKTSIPAGPPANPSRGDIGGGGGIDSMGANLVTTAHCGCPVTGVPGMGSRGVL